VADETPAYRFEDQSLVAGVLAEINGSGPNSAEYRDARLILAALSAAGWGDMTALRAQLADVSDAHHEGFGAGVEWADRYGDLVHHTRDLNARLAAYEDVVAAARAWRAKLSADREVFVFGRVVGQQSRVLLAAVDALPLEGPTSPPSRLVEPEDPHRRLRDWQRRVDAIRATSTLLPTSDATIMTPDTPQTANGALETAIEAADWAYDGAFMAPIDDRAEHQKALIAAVRAAAPLIERAALNRAAAELRTLAAQFSLGWDEDRDRTYVAYGQAFKEAARRINEVADGWLRERARVVSPDGT